MCSAFWREGHWVPVFVPKCPGGHLDMPKKFIVGGAGSIFAQNVMGSSNFNKF